MATPVTGSNPISLAPTLPPQVDQTATITNKLFHEVPAPGITPLQPFPPFGVQPIKATDVNQAYLAFFEQNGHTIIPNVSLIPDNNPTLNYINSGVAGIINYVTGLAQPPAKRLCNVQTCIRTGDIDDVGDPRHLTLFHMLGHWSINDYGKKETIEFAYNFAVNVVKIPRERLYATAFAGDEALGLPRDDEAAATWERMGIPKDRIIFLSKKDNFWGPAGKTGPCGPCSELFFDRGPKFGPDYDPANPDTFDTDRYREIWNPCVAMTLNKDDQGKYTPLKAPVIDAGAGLERFCETLNGCATVYETDLLKPIVEWVTEFLGEKASIQDIRMVTDHLRTSCYILSEGVTPGSSDRQSVLRRLLRRCVQTVLSLKGEANFETVLNKIIPFIGQINPKALEKRDFIIQQIHQEAKDYDAAIGRALKNLNPHLVKGSILAGNVAHNIVKTFGLRKELLEEIISEHQMTIDQPGYKLAEEAHQKVSKPLVLEAVASTTAGLFEKHLQKTAQTVFKGYEESQGTSSILHLFKDGEPVKSVKAGDSFEFVVKETPFYGKGGGQVGDKGTASTQSCNITITDTVKENDVFIHRGTVTKGFLVEGESLTLSVDPEHRAGVKRNHSATHLLQHAIMKVLGLKTAVQQGSLVDADHLRFDFAYTETLEKEKIQEIEKVVNELIKKNSPVVTEIQSLLEARQAGVIAMFGEQYPDLVRVVSMGPSKELCGGTHASSTLEIGSIKILSGKSIARGIKRFEAVTGPEAVKETAKAQSVSSEMKEKPATVSIPNPLVKKALEQNTFLYTFSCTPKEAEAFVDAELKQEKSPALVGAISYDPKTEKSTFLFKTSEEGRVQGLSAKTQLLALLQNLGVSKGGGTDLQAQGGTHGKEAVEKLDKKSNEEIETILFPKK